LGRTVQAGIGLFLSSKPRCIKDSASHVGWPICWQRSTRCRQECRRTPKQQAPSSFVSTPLKDGAGTRRGGRGKWCVAKIKFRKAIKPSIGSHMNAVELRTIAKVTRRLPLEAPVLWRAQFDSSHDGHDSFRTRFCGATRPADVGRALFGPVFPVQVQPRHLISFAIPA